MTKRPKIPGTGAFCPTWRVKTAKPRTGWLCRQSAANPSPPNFPVNQGKYREFSRESACSSLHFSGNRLILLTIFDKFLERRNREFFQPNREFSRDNREMYLRSRVRLNSLAAGSNPGPACTYTELVWSGFEAEYLAHNLKVVGSNPTPATKDSF